MDVNTSTFMSGVYMAILGAGMGGLMQTSTLIAQNSIELRDMGAGTGASTFLRNMGSSLGISLLGAVYVNHLTDSLAGAGVKDLHASATSMTPQALRDLPEAARHIFQQAVTDGVTALFMWGAVVAAIGIVIAVFIRQVPLRGGPAAAIKEAELAEASA
jgi:hypothetical protein